MLAKGLQKAFPTESRRIQSLHKLFLHRSEVADRGPGSSSNDSMKKEAEAN